MKKIVSLLLAVMLILSIGIVTFANSSQITNNGFYVVKGDVPDDVYTHIQGSIVGIVSDLYEINQISVSAPFQLFYAANELYYSLVYSDNEIVGTYRCFEIDGRYTGVFSENSEIIEGFEKVSLLTSPDRPAKIIAGEYNDIYAIIGSSTYTILSDPSGNETSLMTIQSRFSRSMSTQIVDLTEGISLEQTNVFNRSTPSSKFLQIGWKETQGSLPWCMAYVTASIMRYKTNLGIDEISAQSVMEWAHPTLSQTELEDEGLDTAEADAFANTYNIDPVHTSSRRTYAQIVNEIKADNPVAFICDNLNTGAKRTHAFVCRGYNDNSGNPYYSVWNPWYPKFERVYASDNTYVNESGSARYLWASTMYSWD